MTVDYTALEEARSRALAARGACKKAQARLQAQRDRHAAALQKENDARAALAARPRAATARAKASKAKARAVLATLTRKTRKEAGLLPALRERSRTLCARATREEKKAEQAKKERAKLLRRERARLRKLARAQERDAAARARERDQGGRARPPDPPPPRPYEPEEIADVSDIVEAWLSPLLASAAAAAGGSSSIRQDPDGTVRGSLLFTSPLGLSIQDASENARQAMAPLYLNPYHLEVYSQARVKRAYDILLSSPDDAAREIGSGGVSIHTFESAVSLGDVDLTFEALEAMDERLVHKHGEGLLEAIAEISFVWAPQGTRPRRVTSSHH